MSKLSRFIEKPDCYLDTKTGLEWSLTNYGSMPWYDAVGRFDGSNGWRVPTIEELLTLVDYTKYDPVTELPGMRLSYYWSSTTFASITGYAWLVHISDGHSSNYGKSNYDFVRAVRGGQGEE